MACAGAAPRQGRAGRRRRRDAGGCAVAEATVAAPRIGIAWRAPALAVAVAAVAAVVGYWAVALRGTESTDDAFVEGHIAFLSPRVGGQVVEVLVEENQRVRAGDVLVRLDPADFETRVARARADLDAAHNRMAQANAAAEAAAAQSRAAAVRRQQAQQAIER